MEILLQSSISGIIFYIYKDNRMNKDSLGDRMKKYENIDRKYLQPKSWVVVRLDGKAFHTFTRGFNKPFDDVLIKAMQQSLKYVADNVSGFKLGYTQSDEASLVITDTDDITTQGYFDFNIQKIVSVTASMFTYRFNQLIDVNKPALFDSRIFTLPKEEVGNYFVWRQQDWNRNSIQMYARNKFSQKQLHGKNVAAMHDMLYSIGLNWANLKDVYKNGTFYFNKNFDNSKKVWNDIQEILSKVKD